MDSIAAGATALITGYLLGSIPSAYITTRLAKGKDIRNLGGGNVGGLNTYREVGTLAAVTVAFADIGKGAAVIAIAHWLLDLPLVFVLLAGLGAVIGHNWMVWLKFNGGKGAGPMIGALSVAMPLYGYLPGLLIFLGVIVVPLVITRNIALSIAAALLFLPLIVWMGTNSATATLMAVILGLIIGIRYLPTARRAWAKSETGRDFIFDRGFKGRK